MSGYDSACECDTCLSHLNGQAADCRACDSQARSGAYAASGHFKDLLPSRMILCPTCGNKRCPRASHHDNECTGSNEPGQPGSDYTARPSDTGDQT